MEERRAATGDAGSRKLPWILAGVVGCGVLLFVVVFLGATLITPALVRNLDAVRREHAEARLQVIRQRVIDHALRGGGAYPASLEVLYADAGGPLLDPWDRPWIYVRAADGASFVLSSLGADGRPGGEGADADLSVTGPGAGTD